MLTTTQVLNQMQVKNLEYGVLTNSNIHLIFVRSTPTEYEVLPPVLRVPKNREHCRRLQAWSRRRPLDSTLLEVLETPLGCCLAISLLPEEDQDGERCWRRESEGSDGEKPVRHDHPGQERVTVLTYSDLNRSRQTKEGNPN